MKKPNIIAGLSLIMVLLIFLIIIASSQNASAGLTLGTGNNVTVYENATPVPPAPPAPSPGGGGGGGAPTVITKPENYIQSDRDEIKLSIRQGEEKTEQIKIKNTYTNEITVTIDISDIFEFLKKGGLGLIPKQQIDVTLKPGEEQIIILPFEIGEEVQSDVYIRTVTISSDYGTKDIRFIFELNTKEILFDIDVGLQPRYQNVLPGAEIVVETNIFNIKYTGMVDVNISFFIKDMQDNVIMEKKKIISVETAASFIQSFQLPSNIKPGRYVVYGIISYDGYSATSSSTFTVEEKKIFQIPTRTFTIVTAAIVLLMLIVIVFILLVMRHRKRHVYVRLKKWKEKEKLKKKNYVRLGKLKVTFSKIKNKK